VSCSCCRFAVVVYEYSCYMGWVGWRSHQCSNGDTSLLLNCGSFNAVALISVSSRTVDVLNIMYILGQQP